MSDQLRIILVGAHPADIFDQSGRTMAHHAARGDYVGCVVLTHGARVYDAVISDEMHHRSEIPEAAALQALMAERSDVKAEEVRKACMLLGVEEVYFFGADDAVLLVTDEAVRRLARLFRQLRPDVILTHFPKEGDGLTNAHAIAGQIVLHAIALAGGVDPGDRNPPHKVAQFFPLEPVRPRFRDRCGNPRGDTITVSLSTSPMWSRRSWPRLTAWSVRAMAAPTPASASRPATAPSGWQAVSRMGKGLSS